MFQGSGFPAPPSPPQCTPSVWLESCAYQLFKPLSPSYLRFMCSQGFFEEQRSCAAQLKPPQAT